ncbi:hypothetical protein [Pleionea sediminis]|uniref:hypothetical protein n=1 Tax=Pleionea sediminis TaxID=2569479 RepID=UPI001186CC20|nr:hypothetical protein [Pleionea sediminis]
MFDEEDSVEDRVKCDIEIDCANGKAVAWVLRNLADKLERDELDTGWHDVKVPNGDEVGKLYLDFYGIIE